MEELLKEIRDIMAEIRDLMKTGKESQEKAMVDAKKQSEEARKMMANMFGGMPGTGNLLVGNPLRRKEHGE